MTGGKWVSGRAKGVDEMASLGAKAELDAAARLALKVPELGPKEPKPSGDGFMGWRN